MFVTFLRFADNRSAAPEFMAVHNDWIARGFTEALPIFSNSSGPIGSKLKVCAEFIVSPFPPPCDGRALCVSCFERLC
ncbi:MULTISPECIES: hypothetical protein [Sinorhizobium]|uniref:hypothetical protein n=1 Tax=Sinorhizobium TaxID=28105 RepID=UPI000CD464CA|nr:MULTISPECIES: hypothetical protein [Sinorhizobium]POH25828.1 hypothetical protein ATY30_27025 [Sinorhizobium americanum]